MYEFKTETLRQNNGNELYAITVLLDNEDKKAEICECINQIMSGQNRKNIEDLKSGVRGLKQAIDSLKADNERLKNANTNISEMYWEQMNKNIEQKKKIEELEKKVKNAMRFCNYLQTIGGAMESNLKHPISLFSSTSTPNAEPVNCRCSIKPVENEPSEPENKTTNFDKIKELNVEGMAEFISRISDCCAGDSECEECPLKDCLYCSKEKIADWLKKECAE